MKYLYLLSICIIMPRSVMFGKDAFGLHSYINNNCTMVFPAEANLGSDSYYRDYIFGIKIVDMICDGEKIEPHRGVFYMPDRDTSVVRSELGTYHYKINYRSIMSFVKKTEQGQYEYDLYEAPRNVDVVEVYYIVRYPSGLESKVLKSVSHDEFAAQLYRPEKNSDN